jgi:tetratricopeptide (TPR) repeat protein
MKTPRLPYSALLLTGLFILAQSCQFYHNVTAKYNAYFLANERMLSVEQRMRDGIKDNYNEVLQVFQRIDSTSGASFQQDFDYIITKASLPVKWHPQSKWTDDCYLLIGKSRLYQGDFTNATTTFKYVNTQSNDYNARHTALVWLIRAYTDMGDEKSALYVSEVLSKDPAPVSNDNARDFYLTMAHFYRLKSDLTQTLAYLERAIPLIKERNTRQRALFIAAEICRRKGLDQKAGEFYSQLLRSNPSYELLFVSQLNAVRAIDYSDAQAVIRKEKALQRMLNDTKNADYADQILFALGYLEMQRKQPDAALRYFEDALALSKSTAQKAQTYLQTGELYYEQLQQFRKASLYYDSALMLLSEETEGYKDIKKKAEILATYAEAYEQVANADRLLKLAALAPAAREAAIDKEIADEKAAIDRQIANVRKRKSDLRKPATMPEQQLTMGGGRPDAANQQRSWYFDNPQTVAFGKAAFFKTWGNISLTDNWRLADQQLASLPQRDPDNNTPDEQTGLPPLGSDSDIYASVRSKSERLAEIPTDEETIGSLKGNLEENLMELGKIYQQMLKKNRQAYDAYNRVIKEFPQSNALPEALYALVRICTEEPFCNESAYKDQLTNKYPQSVYTRLLGASAGSDMPTQEGSVLASREVDQQYQQAYMLYKQGQYQAALDLLNRLRQNNPANNLMDKIDYVRAVSMLSLNPSSPDALNILKSFENSYPQSALLSMVQALLKNFGGGQGTP